MCLHTSHCLKAAVFFFHMWLGWTEWAHAPFLALLLGSTLWLGPITQWLRLHSIWKIKWGGRLADVNEAPRKKKHAELSIASIISITKEEVGADVMAAAVLPLPWQRSTARQHRPTNSSPPPPGSRVHQILLTEKKRKSKAGHERGWNFSVSIYSIVRWSTWAQKLTETCFWTEQTCLSYRGCAQWRRWTSGNSNNTKHLSAPSTCVSAAITEAFTTSSDFPTRFHSSSLPEGLNQLLDSGDENRQEHKINAGGQESKYQSNI